MAKKNEVEKTLQISEVLAQVRISHAGRIRAERAAVRDALKGCGIVLDRQIGKGADSGLLFPRQDTDAIRAGLAWHMGGLWKAFQVDGNPCRIILAPAKAPAGALRIDLALQDRGNEVEYGRIGRISLEGGVLAFEPGAKFEAVPGEIQEMLSHPGDLLALGRDHLFDSDFRSIEAEILDRQKAKKLWAGTYMVASEEALLAIKGAREVLAGTLQEGKVLVSLIRWATDSANKVALSEEIEQGYLTTMETVLRGLEKGTSEGNAKRIREEMREVEEAVTEFERVLGRKFGEEFFSLQGQISAKLGELISDEPKARGPRAKANELQQEIERLKALLAEKEAEKD